VARSSKYSSGLSGSIRGRKFVGELENEFIKKDFIPWN
jgi:hypothetical protein